MPIPQPRREGPETMIGTIVFLSALCFAQKSVEPTRSERSTLKTEPADRETGDETNAARLAEYNSRKAKTARTAEAHRRLGLWCEKNKLPAEAIEQFVEVVRLDPKRTDVWRKLGYRRVDGRWISEDRLEELRDQGAADRIWVPKLVKLHRMMHKAKTREEAEKLLASIDDPKAVPAIYTVFGSAMPHHQMIAVQLLGQIRAPNATIGLAALAVYGGSAEVRHRATSTLRDRDAEDFIPTLASLLVEPLRFAVQPVGGPGSPGVLIVEGERYDVRRFYAPPAPPLIALQPGDIVGFDALGLPVITRSLGVLDQTNMVLGGVDGNTTVTLNAAIRFDLGKDYLLARRAAVGAQAQLEADVRQIQDLNRAREIFKQHVLSILRDATGADVGDTAEKWNRLAAKARGYLREPPPRDKTKPSKPTLDQLVPLAYNPRFGDLLIVGTATTWYKNTAPVPKSAGGGDGGI